MPNSPKKNQTHCKNGHEFTEENTSIQIVKGIKCRSCKACKKEYMKNYRVVNRARIYKTHNKHWKKWQQITRIKCLTHYGLNGKLACVCCGEDTFAFLTLGHRDNNGQQERKKFGNQLNIMRYIIKNNFPEGYDTECWNCNLGKRSNGGICPHKMPQSNIKITETWMSN